ncbi:MAG: S4 domain-containing protein [Patescibacteria group bacterium]|nr:S4 domain-containing protein [Patescibacteria group bacterium]
MNHSFSILPSQANQRFDRFVARIFDKAKNAEVYRIIREGKIKVNKKKKRNEYILTEGDEITIWMSDEAIAELRTKKRAIHPKNKSFQVIFEDDDYLILDKPSGLPVHGGTNIKGRTLIQEILGYLNHHDAIG